MRITVLGTGRMGTAIAQRLVATGHEVTVWNRTAKRTAEAVAAGAIAVEEATEAVSASTATLVSLADDDAVRSLVDASVVAALGQQCILVDTSTVSPATTSALAKMVGHGRMVAAPVLGAPQAVAAGDATVLLGGPADAIEQLSPLWADLAAAHLVCGEDPGSATSLKLISNYLLLGGLALLAEAVAAAEAAGIDPNILRGFLRASPLVAPGLHNRLHNVLSDQHGGWFTPDQGAKDVRLALALAASGGVQLPLAEIIADRYEESGRCCNPGDDVAAIVELLRTSPR